MQRDFVTIESSDTPIPLDIHLLLLCEILDAVQEDTLPAHPSEPIPEVA